MRFLQGHSRRFWYLHYKQAADLPLCARLHAAQARAIAGGDAKAAGAAADRLIDYTETFMGAGFEVKNPDVLALYQDASATEFAFNFGGGVKYAVSDRWHLRADLRRFQANDIAPESARTRKKKAPVGASKVKIGVPLPVRTEPSTSPGLTPASIS